MKKLTLASMMAVAALAASAIGSAPAAAFTYVANFNSATLDPMLVPDYQDFSTNTYTAGIVGSPYYYTTGNGSLTIGASAPTTIQSEQAFVTNFGVLGNFTATVNVDYSGQDPAAYSTLFAQFFNNSPGCSTGGCWAAFSPLTPDDVVSAALNVDGAPPLDAPEIRSDATDPVTLQISRTGDTVTMSYGPVGGDLTVLTSSTSTSYLGYADFDIDLGAFDTVPNPEQVTFSDFTITADSVVLPAAPEPATWAMMLIGFAGVGIVTRRRAARQDAMIKA